jgi:hypothetical protein
MHRRLTLLATVVAAATVVVVTVLPSGGTSAFAGPPGHATSTASSVAAPAAKAAPARTQRTVVRPVTAAGRPAPGWTVSRLKGAVTCSGRSPSSVDPGVASCYPTAFALRACWKSQDHTALCVRDARVQRLVRVRYTGAFPAAVKAPPFIAPMDLELTNGNACLVRDGGAWGSPPQHPRWVGYYSCEHGSVYGPDDYRWGITRSTQPWQVHVWRSPEGRAGSIVVRDVARTWYVGTAA